MSKNKNRGKSTSSSFKSSQPRYHEAFYQDVMRICHRYGTTIYGLAARIGRSHTYVSSCLNTWGKPISVKFIDQFCEQLNISGFAAAKLYAHAGHIIVQGNPIYDKARSIIGRLSEAEREELIREVINYIFPSPDSR